MKNRLLLIAACCICLVPALAQTDVYNTGIIQVLNSSDTFYITGSFNNTGTASFRNTGGNLYVLQNLANDETSMLPGAGKLWFKGAALQNVTGTQAFRTYNWIVNNAAGVSLQNRVGIGDGIGGNLSFTNGLITSGTALQDVLFYPNSSYSGYADNKHIVGYCSKTGSTNFTFPIGNGSLKADLDIFNLASSTTFQCKYFGAGYGIYTPQSPLMSIFKSEYWTLDRTAGASAAQITLKWNDARKPLNHTAPADLRAGHFTGGIWINEGGTGSGNSSLGTVSSVAVNSFSPFTFASVGVTLPIKITAFSVTASNSCSVTMDWKAEDETAVTRYLLQKSNDGQTWEDIAPVTIRTAINTVTEHRYVDNKTSNGTWMYRIKIENNDGSFYYTNNKMATLTCNAGNMQVFPTLVTQNLYVKIVNNRQIKAILFTNSAGQVVKTIEHPVSGLVTINMAALPAGKYTVSAHMLAGLIENASIIKGR